jgi:hypothetical protein
MNLQLQQTINTGIFLTKGGFTTNLCYIFDHTRFAFIFYLEKGNFLCFKDVSGC